MDAWEDPAYYGGELHSGEATNAPLREPELHSDDVQIVGPARQPRSKQCWATHPWHIDSASAQDQHRRRRVDSGVLITVQKSRAG
jgi:hypothetical protein